jgi:hypothetical protein
MKRLFVLLAALAALAAVMLVGTSAAAIDVSSAAPKATFGWYYDMKSYDQNVRVTLLKMRNPAPPNEDLDPANKYVAVDLIIKNNSRSAYSDTPSDGVALICANHTSVSDTAITNPMKPDLDNDVTLFSKERVQGWITFEVPRSCVPKLFSFDLDTGTNGDPAYWRL